MGYLRGSSQGGGIRYLCRGCELASAASASVSIGAAGRAGRSVRSGEPTRVGDAGSSRAQPPAQVGELETVEGRRWDLCMYVRHSPRRQEQLPVTRGYPRPNSGCLLVVCGLGLSISVH